MRKFFAAFVLLAFAAPTFAAEKDIVDTAKVVKTDIACTNGVIHVIDTVLLPPTK